MPNLIDYINEYGNYSFNEKEFNNIDNLVLSTFSYFTFTDITPSISIEKEVFNLTNYNNYETLSKYKFKKLNNTLNSINNYDSSNHNKTVYNKYNNTLNNKYLLSLENFETSKKVSFFSLFGNKTNIKAIKIHKAISLLDNNEIISRIRLPKDLRLIKAITNSKRFKDILLCFNMEFNHTDLSDLDNVCKFGAITFILNKQLAYVAFKGTDYSLIGWREDFNMGYLSAIPSQKLALAYLNYVSLYLNTDLIVGGHSKGGNLAIYASTYSHSIVQDRIKKIYSNDGPGFIDKIYNIAEYKNIEKKIEFFTPFISIIGILLHHSNDYKVVISNVNTIFQHEPYTWQIENDDFKYLSEISEISDYIDFNFNKLIFNLDPNKRKKYVNIVWKLLISTGYETFPEIIKNNKESLKKIMHTYLNLDSEEKSLVKSSIKALLRKDLIKLLRLF